MRPSANASQRDLESGGDSVAAETARLMREHNR